MKKSATALLCAMALTVSTTIALAHETGHRHHHGAGHTKQHGHRHNHANPGIAIAVGAAALIAAAARAKAHEGNDSYRYHHGYGGRDNSISACLHKAQRRTERAGGHGVTLRNVRRAVNRGSYWQVNLAVKQRLRGGVRRNVVARCRVVGGYNVTRFSFR
jgi:hypothetical protein